MSVKFGVALEGKPVEHEYVPSLDCSTVRRLQVLPELAKPVTPRPMNAFAVCALSVSPYIRNASGSTVFGSLPRKVTEVKAAVFPKAYAPIEETPLGMVTEDSAELS